jgi:hypothetical protein
MAVKPKTTVNGQPGLVVRDVDTDVATDLVADNHYLITAQAVWSNEDNEWVPMVQPTLEATLSGITIEGETQYKDSRFDYDSDGYVVYAGENEVMNASESATDWILYKMYYDLDGNTVQIKSQVGSWQDRSTLVWE